MAWPLSQDYNEAIQCPQTSFADPELRGGRPALNAMGLPIPCSGNFADVYRFTCPATQRTWAVKCFTRQIPGLRERYRQISSYLLQFKLPFMVGFTFLDQGIRIRGDWFPILKMDWAEGLPFNLFVKEHLDKPQVLEKLCQIWVRLAGRLREANVAHCDLQHGNVLLVPGTKTGSLGVKLVDYDGMCVPSLTKLKPLEVGHSSYQHPQRQRDGVYNLQVDRFSHLVIYTALRSLLIGSRDLWDRYDNGDNMLFCQADFKAPGASKLLTELRGFGDSDVRRLANCVVYAAQQSLDRTALLTDLVPDSQPFLAQPVGKPQQGAKVAANMPLGLKRQTSINGAAGGGGTTSPVQRKAKSRLTLAILGSLGALMFIGSAVALIGFAVSPNRPKDGEVPNVDVATNNAEHTNRSPDGKKKELPTDKFPEQQENPVSASSGDVKNTLKDIQIGRGADDISDKTGKLSQFGQLVATLAGHKARVYQVRFSPDGQQLASASLDQTVKLWNTASGKEFATLAGHKDVVGYLSFSPDGRRLASASSDGTVKLWDTSSGKELATLAGHKDAVACVTFSPDGRLLASASLDQTVKLWDPMTGKELATLEGHKDKVQYVSFSPDGQRLASASWDRTVKLWDPMTGKELATLAGHKSAVVHVSFSPDGQRLASASWDSTVKLWDVLTGRTQATLAGHKNVVSYVSFSPDGKLLASASLDKMVKLWNATSGKIFATLAGHKDAVGCVSFSPDGQLLASASLDRTVKVWDATTGKELATLAGFKDTVDYVSFSPDSRRLASAGDETPKLWDVCAPVNDGPSTAVKPGTAKDLTPTKPPTGPDPFNGRLRFVHVPKGTFWMGGGSVPEPSNPMKQVTIANDFELAAYTVTQEQWEAVMGDAIVPSHFSRQGGAKEYVRDVSDAELKRFPREMVSWHEVQQFLKKLNEREKGRGWVYRLPTEAEWEYACRGAATSKEECSFDYYFARPTNDLSWDQAAFDGRFPAGLGAMGPGRNRPMPVGSFLPNKLGLFDMHGNVWQWCEDLFEAGGSVRVGRGGSRSNQASSCRAASRIGIDPLHRVSNVGFRLAAVAFKSATSAAEERTPKTEERPKLLPEKTVEREKKADDEAHIAIHKALVSKLAGTEWVNSSNVSFYWDKSGQLWCDGMPAEFDGIDENSATVDGKSINASRLKFNSDFTRFEQSPSAASKSNVRIPATGKRLDPDDWHQVEMEMEIDGKGRLNIAATGMRWLDAKGKLSEISLANSAWNVANTPALDHAALSKIVGKQLDIHDARVLQIIHPGGVANVERDKFLLAVILDRNGEPGAGKFRLLMSFRSKIRSTAGVIERFAGHDGPVNDIAIMPDGRGFVSAGDDKTVRRWVLETGKESSKSSYTKKVEAVAVSANGKTIKPGLAGEIRYPIQAALNGTFVFCTAEKTFGVFDPSINKVTSAVGIDVPSNAWALAFSPDCLFAVVAQEGVGGVRVVKTTTGKAFQIITSTTPEPAPSAAAISSDSKKMALIAGSDSNYIALYDLASVATQKGQGQQAKVDFSLKMQFLKMMPATENGPVTVLRFSPDSRRLISGHVDGSIRIWDVNTLEEKHWFQASKARITRAVFMPDGRRLLVATNDGSIVLWALPD